MGRHRRKEKLSGCACPFFQRDNNGAGRAVPLQMRRKRNCSPCPSIPLPEGKRQLRRTPPVFCGVRDINTASWIALSPRVAFSQKMF